MTRLAPESETVEYKTSLSELREGIISMVAMLNKNGHGDVYFGVRDDGEITGLKVGKDTVKNITSTVFDSTDPHVIPELKVLQEDGLDYVKMSAAGKNRPYFYKNVVYVRAGEEDRKAPSYEIRRMFRSSEDLLIQTVSPDQDLSFAGLRRKLESRGMHPGSEGSLESSCSLRNRQGTYNIQARLLSDQNDAQVIVTVFKGKDRTVFSRRNVFSGRCLLDVVEDVNDYVQSMNETVTRVDSKGRTDTPLFDPTAFKEAWVNACVHNSWIIGTPPYIQIFDDRMEIASFGGLPYWMSQEEFYGGVSVPVNESLMRVFLMAGVAEHTGHGVPEIVRRYGRGSIEISEGTVKVTLGFSSDRAVSRIRAANEDSGPELSEEERRILATMFENPRITMDELSKATGINRSTVGRRCLDMQEKGVLERVGSKKTGKWSVKADVVTLNHRRPPGIHDDKRCYRTRSPANDVSVTTLSLCDLRDAGGQDENRGSRLPPIPEIGFPPSVSSQAQLRRPRRPRRPPMPRRP